MSRRILVVEDHEENRRIIRDLLTSADLEMIEALTGEEGVRRDRKARSNFLSAAVRESSESPAAREAGARSGKDRVYQRTGRSRCGSS